MRRVFALYKEDIRFQRLRRNLQETLVRIPGHQNINIIIPWDKALMPDRAKQRPRVKLKRDIVLLTYIREGVQQYF